MTSYSSAVDVSGLRNSGLLVVREATESQAARTFIVVGVARGGTTMVAKALHDLGIPMGERLSSVYEDVDVCRPMEDGDAIGLRDIVARRNASYPKWGFKRPGAAHYVRKFESEFRNPCYVIVFRDILALTNRNRLSVGQDVLNGLRLAAKEYVKLAELSAALEAPTLLVSYEKALMDPDGFVASLAAFAGIDDPVCVERARGAVDPGNDRYLEESRTRRGVGRLDGVVERRVKGWAALTGVAEAVDVRLVLNGEELGVVRADVPRNDLKGYHPDGARAFEFPLPDSVVLAPGDVLGARIVGEIKDLGNSPIRIGGVRPRQTVAASPLPAPKPPGDPRPNG